MSIHLIFELILIQKQLLNIKFIKLLNSVQEFIFKEKL
nr:MAG TPA: hypothetical protein [Caudoviricetes sp.]